MLALENNSPAQVLKTFTYINKKSSSSSFKFILAIYEVLPGTYTNKKLRATDQCLCSCMHPCVYFLFKSCRERT